MAEVSRGFWLLYDSFKYAAPWCCLLGAPNYPQYTLFVPSTTFGNSTKIEKEYDTSGNITKVKGTNSSLQTAEIQFTYDNPNKKITLECYQETTKELTIVEQYKTDGSLDIITTCHLDTSKNISVNVARSSTKRLVYNLIVNVNSQQITGSITWNDTQVPQVILDVMSEIDDIADPEEIAIFEPKILESLLGEGISENPARYFGLDENDLCLIGGLACLCTGPIAAYAGVAWMVANWGVCKGIRETEV